MIKSCVVGKSAQGEAIEKFKISNCKGESVEILNLGGIITSINLLDAQGEIGDVVLGYDNLKDYLKNPNYFGAIVGRYAGRIKNSMFELLGKEYKLSNNEGVNHLHGGNCGFDKKVYSARVYDNSLELSAKSLDKEEGYPFSLDFKVKYVFDDQSSLTIEYEAISSGDTLVNLTNHTYFNLDGNNDDILSHKVWIDANYIVKLDEGMVPYDDKVNVLGTALDFTTPKTVGEEINANNPYIKLAGGYDFCYILNQVDNKPKAKVWSQKSGRVLSVYTDNPCIVFYTSNMLDDSGKQGIKYGKHKALCLECQGFAPNFSEARGSQILKKGSVYKRKTIYQFECAKRSVNYGNKA